MKYIILTILFYSLGLSQSNKIESNSKTITEIDSLSIKDTIQIKKDIEVKEIEPVKEIEIKESKVKNVSVQCSGRTQKRTRCKKMTKSPNGYCHLHGGN